MFYMGYYRSRPKDIVPYAEANDIGLLTSAAGRWSARTDRFNQLWDYDTPHIVDSGGYTVLNNFGAYPWSVEEYHEWLEANTDRFTWAAVMDYICADVFDDLYTIDERQQLTLENTLGHFELDPSYILLPVLQGRTVDQYVSFYDQLVDHGIPVEYVGLGSIQAISNGPEVARVEQAVRNRCPRIERIHGFGIKANSFRYGASFDSADSQVWTQAKTHGMVYRLDGNRLYKEPLSDPQERTFESFKNYHRYASRLMRRATTTPSTGQSLSPSTSHPTSNLSSIGSIPLQSPDA